MLSSNQDELLPQHPWKHSLPIWKFTLCVSTYFVNTLIFSSSIYPVSYISYFISPWKCNLFLPKNRQYKTIFQEEKQMYFGEKKKKKKSTPEWHLGRTNVCFPKSRKQQSISCPDSADSFPDPGTGDRKTTILFPQQPLCQNDAEPGDTLSHPEMTRGYTLLSLGKADRESHGWHPICQEILLALPSKYIQNQMT